MADFRRPPEWQQQADRHTQLTDPVLTVRSISRFDPRRPATGVDHALVFTTAKGAYDAFIPPHRPSRGDTTAKRYTAVYEVDMGQHAVHLDLELPSDDDAFTFTAGADLSWRVADPAQYVASGERDVPARLRGELEHLARAVTRGFPIERSPAAEAAVQRAVDSLPGGLAAGTGLRVGGTVRLSLDEGTLAHRRQLRDIRYAGELLDPQHELRMRAQHQQHELELLRTQQLQEINAQKINFYQYHLQQGGVAAWALHLAQHPEDSRLVMESMRADQLAMIQSQLGVAEQLLKGDGLEDYQKEEPRRLALQVVNDILNQRLPGVAQQPPPAAPGAESALSAGGPADTHGQTPADTHGQTPADTHGQTPADTYGQTGAVPPPAHPPAPSPYAATEPAPEPDQQQPQPHSAPGEGTP
ncbi:PE-PGRS family protein [Streptomyces sp. B-S-A8]|uniref:PE-PGRS family protein n=1 Tax=Streptomyces solicavernae TaxID=3043614 RepID=A0ABT6RMY6_9ACTN|nr:PE-PGRS family protein [Streptomyces sp. B-S-A8]MDI3385774.1 PE-PGRS family protein [Streptomyces sp. B-S-A8]